MSLTNTSNRYFLIYYVFILQKKINKTDVMLIIKCRPYRNAVTTTLEINITSIQVLYSLVACYTAWSSVPRHKIYCCTNEIKLNTPVLIYFCYYVDNNLRTRESLQDVLILVFLLHSRRNFFFFLLNDDL